MSYIGIVCYRLAGRNRIFDFHSFASAFGKIDCSKRNVEVKGHLSEVSGLAVRDSRILLAVSKAKLQLEPYPVIFKDIKGRLCSLSRSTADIYQPCLHRDTILRDLPCAWRALE